MKTCEKWLCLTLVLAMFHTIHGAVPFKKVALATTSKSTTTTTASTTTIGTLTEETSFLHNDSENGSYNGTTLAQTKNSKLTGIPQIDYIWDPNLPRELRGYNLSSYPFFASVPPEEDIHFKCDGLHDGFYASIEHKCQLYHHCVYGIRHDFLCANFTAFDQKTFICHFVSDVDCEGSQKYWNRNDDLYMATTTTSTTTTTTEPPPTTPRKKLTRPLRPLRRPVNHRRPFDDEYYYDEEDYDYDDDYYEQVVKRRRKQRPRHRKPLIDYEDEYEDEKRPINVKHRRMYSRDRFREVESDIESHGDYEAEHREFERPKSRYKPTAAVERKKNSRKAGTLQNRSNVEDRRSLVEDRRLKLSPTISDDSSETLEPIQRRPHNRKRLNGRRSSLSSTGADAEELEEYDKNDGQESDADETVITPEEEVSSKVKTTSKTVEELIAPKAAPSSVYAKPRAPPRIARPVPINEKKKFQYTVHKSGSTTRPISSIHPAQQGDDLDYYEDDEEYDDIRHHRGNPRRRVITEKKYDGVDVDEDELPSTDKRRHKQNAPRTLRKPVIINKKPITTTAKTIPLPINEEDDYDTDESYVDRIGQRRRNNYTRRTHSKFDVTEDADFIEEDDEERPLKRLKPNIRKGLKKSRVPSEAEVKLEESEEDISEKKRQRNHKTPNAGRRTRPASNITTRTRTRTSQSTSVESNSEQTDEIYDPPLEPGKSLTATSNQRSTAVRVVKRPFLPSRGGSPYLPRGLQPVGIAIKPLDTTTTTTTTTSDHNRGVSFINMGSTISGVHLLEHGSPLLRDSGPPRTTLSPRSPIPITKPKSELSAPKIPNKATLDELYETDYDVTLNDALNPTLKPLSPHQPLQFQQFHQQKQHFHQANQSLPYNSNSRPNSNGIYSSAPQSETSFLHHHNNQSLSSRVIIDHHIHHHQLPSSSLSLSPLSHHHNYDASAQKQIQSQAYHFHQPSEHHELLLQHQSINDDRVDNNDSKNNYNSDTYFSSTDIRQRTIASAPSQIESNRHVDAAAVINSTAPPHHQQPQNFYEDYDYY